MSFKKGDSVIYLRSKQSGIEEMPATYVCPWGPHTPQGWQRGWQRHKILVNGKARYVHLYSIKKP